MEHVRRTQPTSILNKKPPQGGFLFCVIFSLMKPTILVHGIWDSSKKMAYIAEGLEKSGRKTYSIDLYPSSGRIGLKEMALQLKSFIDERGLSDFDIVAFSMGGIVSKYYICELGGSDYASSFVTISSPHHGTLMGYLYPFAIGKELRIGSPILKSLEEKMKSFGSIKSLSIRTPFDLMILPSKSSIISWGENLSFPIIAHPLMVRNPIVLGAILDFLGR